MKNYFQSQVLRKAAFNQLAHDVLTRLKAFVTDWNKFDQEICDENPATEVDVTTLVNVRSDGRVVTLVRVKIKVFSIKYTI